ncbi:MAG: 23S rRNA (adenine(2503)-C(2))-methyltransferase RlmN [Firmicutes bacterium]|nr:23S rRNA (adenine(2503)-C(2))-methyltransferase RlmN [Bacillota bacterium]
MEKVLVGKTLDELKELVGQWGEPTYRAEQLAEWLYKPAATIEEMTNLPKGLRERLARESIHHPCLVQLVRKSYDGTRKYLLALEDGELIEAVFIPETERTTVCISTQVGCKMGCTFCATGSRGLARNLTPGEIVDQVLQVALDVGYLPSNVVYMGMGEPLANYDALLRSIEIINAPWGLNIGIRQITVSTCGLVPGIERLGEAGLGLTLAVSLHAANDEKRNRIMPINWYYGLDELLQALHGYVRKTSRRITIEYALMSGFNDAEEDARRLVRILRGLLCHVNLIPVNPIQGAIHQRPRPGEIERFQSLLRRGGLEVSIRKERGADIEAACGQLRGQWEET